MKEQLNKFILLLNAIKRNPGVAIGLFIMFSAPLIHFVHFYASTEPFEHPYYQTIQDLVWVEIGHTELILTLVGYAITTSYQSKHWIYLVIPVIVHCVIDFSLNAVSTDVHDLWIVHKITYGAFACVQGIGTMFYISKNEWL